LKPNDREAYEVFSHEYETRTKPLREMIRGTVMEPLASEQEAAAERFRLASTNRNYVAAKAAAADIDRLCVQIEKHFLVADFDLRDARKKAATQLVIQSAEPPKLQFLAWQDEWQTNQPGAARHPDGSPVTNENELNWLRLLPPPHQEHGYLHLWFSHPLFDKDSNLEYTLFDAAGKVLPFRNGGSATARHAASTNIGSVGWLTHSFIRGPEYGLPEQFTLKLRYTIGPWEHEQTVRADAKFQDESVILEKGVEVRSIGQDARGGTFLALAYGMSAMGNRQFGVVAVGKDGRDLGAVGSSRGGQYDEQRQQLVERFYFQVPLTDIASFRIGTRPVHTMEWSNVGLRGN
jgi:hypothetical protein